MYVPKFFELHDQDEIDQLIDQFSFGELITVHKGELFVNHIPFLYDKTNNKLLGHLAKQNPQLEMLEGACDLRVVFQGNNAYVSPSWYASENMVPTWNFECVHVSGKAKCLDHDALIDILERLSHKHEQQFAQPWTMDKVSDKALNAMTKAIVAFEINIDSIQAKQKLSQNRGEQDRQGVINGLVTQEDTASKAVAEKMQLLETKRTS